MISVVLFGHKSDSFSGHFESLTPYYPKEPGLVWFGGKIFLYHFLYSYIWNAQILDKFLAVYCSCM